MNQKKLIKRGLLLGTLAGIFIISVVHVKYPPVRGADKIKHFLSYFILSFVFYWNDYSFISSVLYSFLYGIFLEGVQYFIPYRCCDFYDLFANGSGIILFSFITLGNIKRKRYFSKFTIFISIFIIVSASFMRQVVDFIRDNYGNYVFSISVWSVFVLILLGVIYYLFRQRPKILKVIGTLLLITLSIFFLWQIKNPAERIHILEYGILGWFAVYDLKKREEESYKKFLLPLILIIMISALDESFQWILPYRVGDFKDLGFNILGGITAQLLYFASKNKN